MENRIEVVICLAQGKTIIYVITTLEQNRDGRIGIGCMESVPVEFLGLNDGMDHIIDEILKQQNEEMHVVMISRKLWTLAIAQQIVT